MDRRKEERKGRKKGKDQLWEPAVNKEFFNKILNTVKNRIKFKNSYGHDKLNKAHIYLFLKLNKWGNNLW